MATDIVVKSSRHTRITGDFAEGLVLYWLSRDGFECARVDHTGIDLLARNRHTGELMGISVKSRSRSRGSESSAVSWKVTEFAKVAAACAAFNCKPYYAVVVDVGNRIQMYLASDEQLRAVARISNTTVDWLMKKDNTEKYRGNAEIRCVELTITECRWWSSPSNPLPDCPA